MALFKKTKAFSMAGISIAGGVTHNIGQLAAAMFIVENFSLMYYLPVLLISGLGTGLLIGIVAMQVYKRILPVTANNGGRK